MTPRNIAVVDYDQEWPRRAGALVEELTIALGTLARRIDHIGSTAIPGMAAKDVLDIQVSVDDLDRAVEAFDPGLYSLGFKYEPHDRDHVPAGCLDNPSLWMKRMWSRRGTGESDINLHVRRLGSPNERLALLFRDWFRTHPSAVPAYAAFKRALADVVPGTAVYSDVKDPVVDLVVTMAETWATHTSWSP